MPVTTLTFYSERSIHRTDSESWIGRCGLWLKKISVIDRTHLLPSVATIPTIRYPRQPTPPNRVRERGAAAAAIAEPCHYQRVRRWCGVARNILCVIGLLWIFHITWELISGEDL